MGEGAYHSADMQMVYAKANRALLNLDGMLVQDLAEICFRYVRWFHNYFLDICLFYISPGAEKVIQYLNNFT